MAELNHTQSPIPRLRLPLLIKDLTEMAARPRTYLIRCVYVIALVSLSAIVFDQSVGRSFGFRPMEILGTGRDLLTILAVIQLAGIYVFLPAMVCGSITQEKERNTLTLLLLTDLKPGEILLQKLLARLVPMFTFLLIGLPVLAVAYALGGVTTHQVAIAAYVLLLTGLQVAAAGIVASAFASTTTGAFMLSYFVLVAGYGLLPICAGVLVWLNMIDEDDAFDAMFAVIPGYWFYKATSTAWGPRLADLFGASLAVWGSIAALLAIGRWFLVTRATRLPRSALLGLFRKLDRVYESMNRGAGGIVLIKDRTTLPTDRPVAWREKHLRALGNPRYQFRLLMILEAPVLLVALLSLTTRSAGKQLANLLVGIEVVLWPIVVLVLAISAAGVFCGERSRGTIDVLLTTPIRTRDLIAEKARTMHRLSVILAIPLLTAAAFVGWWTIGDRLPGRNEPSALLVMSVLAVAVYLPMVLWLSMLIGLLARSPTRAIITTLTILIAWCVVPVGLQEWLGFYGGLPRLLSPFGIFFYSSWEEPITRNFIAYAAVAFMCRGVCYRYADRLLGRVAPLTSIERRLSPSL